MRYSRYWILAITLMVVLSCSEDESTPLTPPPRGIQTTVSLSPPRVVAGQTHEIIVEVVNNGPALELDTRCAVHLGYRIRSADGSLVISNPGPTCQGATGPLRLGPGERRTVRHTRTASMSPARYVVEAGIVDNEEKYPWAKETLVVLYPSELSN